MTTPDQSRLARAPKWTVALPGAVAALSMALCVGFAGELIESEGPDLSRPELPCITRIDVGAAEVVVTVEVPAGLGIKKITLESRDRIGAGTWRPRAVRRLDSGETVVAFRLPKSPALEVLRVRADDREPVPASFYSGTNRFAGASTVAPGSYSEDATLGFGRVSFDAQGGVPYQGGLGPAPQVPNVITLPREVIESDIWRLQGDTLYYFNQYRGLQIIDLTQPSSPVVRGRLSLPADGEQMYLLDQAHALLLTRGGCTSGQDRMSRILVVDVGAPEPEVVSSLDVPGYILESRLVGTALYVASQGYRRVSGGEGDPGSWEAGVFVNSYDLVQPAAPLGRDTLWYPGYGNVISATDTYLFVATQTNWRQSIVHIIDISAEDGKMTTRSHIEAAGHVKDKFKMSVHEDVFTVISEEWSVENSALLGTAVETFSIADAAVPRKLGSLRIAEGESLHATRFDGDKVYVVTFRRIDPLWVVDLKDPAHPAISGELQVPGYSTFIYPMQDRLVTVGIDNSNSWRVAVSLFDVRDPVRPGLLSRVVLSEGHSSSEANDDEKAFTVLPEAGLILLPFHTHTTNGYSTRMQILDLGADSIKARGSLEHTMDARRATLHRDHVISVSGFELLSADISDRDRPVVRAMTELAWPANRVFLAGGYLVEVGSPDDAQDPSVLRIAPAEDPDRVLSQTVLDSTLPVLGATVSGDHLYVIQGPRFGPYFWVMGGDLPYTTRTESLAGGQQGATNVVPTNSPNIFLTVFDLGSLPELRLAGQTETYVEPQALCSKLAPVWPRPDLLVWSGSGGASWYWWRWHALNVAGAGFAPDFAWPGWGGPSDSLLLAFDVRAASRPALVSSIRPAGTNEWWQVSSPVAVEGLVYLSHTSYDPKVIGFNTNIHTVTTYEQITNVVILTNFNYIPHWLTVTNTGVLTNEVVGGKIHQVASSGAYWRSLAGRGQALASGTRHLVCLSDGGVPMAWGENSQGQLGDGTDGSRGNPQPVTGLNGMVSVAAGSQHSLALGADGTAWAWGSDAYGQLGDGVPSTDGSLPPMPELGSPVPVRIEGLQGASSLVAGTHHCLALKGDGTVWAWGENAFGSIGDGSLIDRRSPVLVPGLDRIAAVAAGGWHSIALSELGHLWTWGRNDRGQLGDGTTAGRSVASIAPLPESAVAAAAGVWHTLVLTAGGEVWACGANDYGQLGDGTTEDRSELAPVPSLTGVVAVSAGARHSLALKNDGTLWAWGGNDECQLGDATQLAAVRPRQVPGCEGLLACSAGANYSAALKDDGTVWCWGGDMVGNPAEGQIIIFTNRVPFTNVTFVVEWETVTNVICKTNVAMIPRTTIQTNVTPMVRWTLNYYLDVVDYADPVVPTVRPPVNIPGELRGVSHNGALIHTAGFHWKPNGSQRDGRWLDLVAYDGVQAALVDSLSLTNAGSQPVVAPDGVVFLLRSLDGGTKGQVESWRPSDDDGHWKMLGSAGLDRCPNYMRRFDSLLAVGSAQQVDLLDVSNPQNMLLLRRSRVSGCLRIDLDNSAASLGSGLWLPAGDFGVLRIDLEANP